ncbi:hypothetical protein T492DRAFT_923222 [Pavlovales sp. CCMP2436]|nr:hypothetical protein T492DRAFT_923222 [Pavlovales sp. CCMP2436]
MALTIPTFPWKIPALAAASHRQCRVNLGALRCRCTCVRVGTDDSHAAQASYGGSR